MSLLYETVYIKRQKIRAKSVSRQLQEEAPFWRVVEVYKVGSIYMTPEQLKTEIKKAVDNAASQKGLKVLSYRILDMWAEWKVVYTEYFCRYEVIFSEASSMAKPKSFSPVAIGTIIVVLAIVVGLLIILYIVLVAREIVEGIFKFIPPELKPAVATLLMAGLGLVIVGGGIYLIKSVIPKIKRK